MDKRTPEPDDHATLMAREAAEAPARIAAMMAANADLAAGLAARLRDRPPRLIMTCARGSSDHAATYLQFLSHVQLGLPAMSLAPSIASVYAADIVLDDVLFVVISQSGQSPDLVAGARWAARHGAHVVAIVNAEDSPVAAAAHNVIPLHAGAEKSVAATKSFLGSLAAILQLVAAMKQDDALDLAVSSLAGDLKKAAALDWSAAIPMFAGAQNAFVVGRGQGFGAAAEMALKFKETSAIHAEAVSSAEIMHGPLGLLQAGLPILLVGQNDATLDSMRKLAALLKEKGASVCAACEGIAGISALPVVPGLNPAVAPLAAVQSFYRFASDLALARGFDPDQPEHLRKVTETR